MEMFLFLFQMLVAAFLLPTALWIAGLWFLAWRSRHPRRPPPETDKTPFIAIIVPAHDERDVIGETVEKIFACDYPRDRFQIYVVADNCSDDTAEIAEVAGAEVLRRKDEVERGKGYALAYALEQIKTKDFDAVLFLDADSSPEPDYLRVMARYLARGDVMIQGWYEVDDPNRNWFTRLTSVSFVLRNRWQFPAYDALGLTLPLRGSGMCFAAPLIRTIGWESHGLSEDVEMTLRLVHDGVPVTFAAQAVSRQFMPTSPAKALTQRMRWSAGESSVRSVLMRREIPWALRLRRWRNAISLFMMAAPPFSMQMCAALAFIIPAYFAGSFLWPLSWVIVAAFAGYFLLGLERLDRQGVVAAAMLPVFALWRVGVYIIACIRKPSSWIRTPRS